MRCARAVRGALLAGAVTSAAVAGACGGDDGVSTPTTARSDDSGEVAGPTTASTRVPVATPGSGTPPVGSYGAGWSPVGAGIGYLELHPDGSGRVRGLAADGLHESDFDYRVDGDRMELTATSGDCIDGALGTYSWSTDDGALALDLIHDACTGRGVVVPGGSSPPDQPSWYPLGDTGVIDAAPGVGPIAVSSPLGVIEWRVLPGRPFRSDPVVFGDGFAGVVDEDPPREGDADPAGARIIVSEDATTWRPLPGPPVPVDLVAASGDELYAIAASMPTDLYVTSDGGRSWRSLPVGQPVPREVTGLFAGPAGVVLTGVGTVDLSAPPAATAPGGDDGVVVRVEITGLDRHAGDEFAGVLYDRRELDDLDAHALGGFSARVTADGRVPTVTVRRPGVPGDGSFPYVSEDELLVRPGGYTLVLWTDTGLGPARRWVPVNTDGRGLFGCQTELEVRPSDMSRGAIDLTLAATLQPDGWNVDCRSGAIVPGTDAAAEVSTVDPALGRASGPDALDTSMWAATRAGLDGGVVAHVDSAPSPVWDVQPLSDGFFACALPEVGDCWRSDDGRSWTLLDAAPRGLHAQAARGDGVYGATAVDQGVTSPDGGRTWSDPVVRPGGPYDWLTVSDAGMLAVETALFGPPVGVVWGSADDEQWVRVLNPWPPVWMERPLVVGDVILIPGERCDAGSFECERLDWVGRIG